MPEEQEFMDVLCLSICTRVWVYVVRRDPSYKVECLKTRNLQCMLGWDLKIHECVTEAATWVSIVMNVDL